MFKSPLCDPKEPSQRIKGTEGLTGASLHPHAAWLTASLLATLGVAHWLHRTGARWVELTGDAEALVRREERGERGKRERETRAGHWLFPLTLNIASAWSIKNTEQCKEREGRGKRATCVCVAFLSVSLHKWVADLIRDHLRYQMSGQLCNLRV